MPSTGVPVFGSRFSLISMPSGLLEPVSCSAIRCAATSPSSAIGIAITCSAKNRFRVASETL